VVTHRGDEEENHRDSTVVEAIFGINTRSMVNLITKQPPSIGPIKDVRSLQGIRDDKFSNETIKQNLSIDQLLSSKDTIKNHTLDSMSPKHSPHQSKNGMLIQITSHPNSFHRRTQSNELSVRDTQG
jgi:hypothetical protein